MALHNIFTPAVAFVVTLITIKLIFNFQLGKALLDKPNDRSLHSTPVPRIGGLAIMAGVFASFGFFWSSLSVLLVSLSLLVSISFLDDWVTLRSGIRLLIHFAAAVIILYAYFPTLSGLKFFIALIAIVWMTNLYNFMDGSDGLAGGMAVFGFGIYALAAYIADDMELMLISTSIVTATSVFLYFNFHPARIFMGDAGSIPIGFMAAVIGLVGWKASDWPIWFPLLVFSPFVVDASVILIKRLFKGERIWQAHRSHYYQKLVQLGWGHRKTAIVEYALMIMAGSSAIILIKQPIATIALCFLLWGFIYLLIAWIIDRQWARREIN